MDPPPFLCLPPPLPPILRFGGHRRGTSPKTAFSRNDCIERVRSHLCPVRGTCPRRTLVPGAGAGECVGVCGFGGERVKGGGKWSGANHTFSPCLPWFCRALLGHTRECRRLGSPRLTCQDLIPSIHHQRLAGDPTRFIGSEIECRKGDILWLALARQSRLRQPDRT